MKLKFFSRIAIGIVGLLFGLLGRGVGKEWTGHGSDVLHSNETWFMAIALIQNLWAK